MQTQAVALLVCFYYVENFKFIRERVKILYKFYSVYQQL